jgi:hypothetical protein
MGYAICLISVKHSGLDPNLSLVRDDTHCKAATAPLSLTCIKDVRLRRV